jgi:hypothetical protein
MPLVTTKKICNDCKYFIANDRKCSKFGEVNIITGRETYEKALDIRENDNKCGEDAKYFEKNNFKIITVPYYFLKDYWKLTPLLGLVIYSMYLLYEISNRHY